MTLWTVACQAPLSMGFSKQEYWSELSFLSPGDLLDPGTEPKSLTSPALAGGFFTTSTTWEALTALYKAVRNSPELITIALSLAFITHDYKECSLITQVHIQVAPSPCTPCSCALCDERCQFFPSEEKPILSLGLVCQPRTRGLPIINRTSRDFPGGRMAKTPHAPTVGSLGLIPGQGTIPHMQQLGVSIPQLKIQSVSTKTRHSLINTYKIK